MTKVLLYPTPASKKAMLGKLFAFAGVAARPAPFLLPLPFASDFDREAARSDVEALVARRYKNKRQALSAAEQASFFRRYARLQHHARLIASSAARRGFTHFAIWNGVSGKRSIICDAVTKAGLNTIFAELSPFPGRITLDPSGINASSSLPKDPDFYRSWADRRPADVDLVAIGAALRARGGIRRESHATETDGPFVFVPLQVQGDIQVTRFGGWIRGIPDLIDQLAAASRHLPTGWRLVFREHPSCRIGNADQLKRLAGGRIAVDNTTDTFELVRRSEAVVTLNSSVGLQSFFFDKPVLVLGQANYALAGLAARATNASVLAAAMTSPLDWSFDEALRQAFLKFLLAEYYVTWPAPDVERLRRQVQLRLEGRITDRFPFASEFIATA